VRCGHVSVPLHHDRPDEGGEIQLAVAVFPAAGPSESTPLVVLAGGPGERLVEPILRAAAVVPELAGELAPNRDLVVIDQRGVGLSRPALGCPEVFAALVAPGDPSGDPAAVTRAVVPAYQACRDRLVGAGVDLSGFTTLNDAEDIDDVRQALGYAQVDLFGTSYGARLALQVARDHAEGLSSLILSSPVPAEQNFLADAGPSFDRALRALDETCALRVSCAEAYPDVLATLEATLERLEANPAQVAVPAPDGTVRTIQIDGYALASVIYSLFYVMDGPAVMPLLISRAAQGDFSLLLAVTPTLTEAPVDYGLQASFLCAEEAVHTPPADATGGETLAARLLIETNPFIGPGLEQICAVWDVPPAPALTFEPVVTDVPTLVVTGRFDQITPPEYGQEIATALPNSTYVEIQSQGHSPLLNGGTCGVSLLARFLAAPREQPDTSCAYEPVPFLLPTDLPSGTSGPPAVEEPVTG
jgi:pimeloyl-ACP methyl ester carboxylesterase